MFFSKKEDEKQDLVETNLEDQFLSDIKAPPIDTFKIKAPQPDEMPQIQQNIPVEPKKEPEEDLNCSLDFIPFSDLYFTPEKIPYIPDPRYDYGLKVLKCCDAMDFYKLLEDTYAGDPSFSVHYKSTSYRVERIMTSTGVHYTARRMPSKIPDIDQIGLPPVLVKQLKSLNKATGLILISGPTGMGKTTSASALLRYFLENEGGFAYTIEDPPEMPMDGVYNAKMGGIGLCKQTEVIKRNWQANLESALRSRPRYLFVGECRTPETANALLRAATSGHLVISTIHANGLEDSLNSIVKYAVASGLNEELAADLLARGILATINQKLEKRNGKLFPTAHFCFANPDLMEADQMRMLVRDTKINLATLRESQLAKLNQGIPLFK